MLKAPLTHEATITNVESFLAAQYVQHTIARRIARCLARRAARERRLRWLMWLRIMLLVDALGLTMLVVYIVTGGAR